MPPVAVLMAAYNAEKTLLQAGNSLLQGTEPCRIYIVDDCSRIPVADVIGPHDPARIEIIRCERNGGPAAARNAGLAHILANGHEFVAIMDADDVARPQRLEKQRAFLVTHDDIALVGSWERYFDEHSGETVGETRPPATPNEIRAAGFLNLSVPHSTWMVRTKVLADVGLYDERYAAAEDYELFRRITRRYKAANVPEFLMDYRISSGGISQRRRVRQLRDRLTIQLRYFEPREWRAWAGVARTAASFLIPKSLAKKISRQYGANASNPRQVSLTDAEGSQAARPHA